jgi:hypothetical protein
MVISTQNVELGKFFKEFKCITIAAGSSKRNNEYLK